MNMITHTNEETTLKFTEAYRKCECLWNTITTIIKIKKAGNAAYKEIKGIMWIDEFGEN